MHGFPFGGHPVTALASIKATHRSDSVVIGWPIVRQVKLDEY
ncbi:uncharacterized protein BCN122_I1401 [Burkholderia cenocepacia]|nr:uncharacterized protein BCN122_I1401 [Burkholderia cenocepacia]